MILRYPGRVPAARRYEKVVSSMDLAPMLLRAAGGELPRERPFDGVDLLPHLNSRNAHVPHSVLCRENRAWLGPRGKQRPIVGQYNQATRKGKWNAVGLAGDPEWQRFDLENDPGEKHVMAAEHLPIVTELDGCLCGGEKRCRTRRRYSMRSKEDR